MQNNVLDYLNDSLKRVPDKIAYADDEVELSFADVKRIMDSVGTGLLNEYTGNRWSRIHRLTHNY